MKNKIILTFLAATVVLTTVVTPVSALTFEEKMEMQIDQWDKIKEAEEELDDARWEYECRRNDFKNCTDAFKDGCKEYNEEIAAYNEEKAAYEEDLTSRQDAFDRIGCTLEEAEEEYNNYSYESDVKGKINVYVDKTELNLATEEYNELTNNEDASAEDIAKAKERLDKAQEEYNYNAKCIADVVIDRTPELLKQLEEARKAFDERGERPVNEWNKEAPENPYYKLEENMNIALRLMVESSDKLDVARAACKEQYDVLDYLASLPIDVAKKYVEEHAEYFAPLYESLNSDNNTIEVVNYTNNTTIATPLVITNNDKQTVVAYNNNINIGLYQRDAGFKADVDRFVNSFYNKLKIVGTDANTLNEFIKLCNSIGRYDIVVDLTKAR